MSKQTEYKNNYIAANYDRINLTVPKGLKAEIEAFAKAEGKSTNGFLNDLIRVALEKEPAAPKAPKPKTAPKTPKKKEIAPTASKKDMDIFLF